MQSSQKGLLNVYQRAVTARGPSAWVLTAILFGFYIDLYYYEHFTPVAHLIGLPDKWFLYGMIYSIAIIVGGCFFLKKHGNNKYHFYRTLCIMFVQVLLAFTLPLVMKLFGQREYYFSYLWPLKIDYFYPSTILEYPLPMVLYSFLGSMILFPVLAFFLGKRFYCSWICGCGGLANTAGDSFRHLSSKSVRAWKIEMVTMPAILLLAFATTAIVFVNWAIGESYPTFSSFAFKVQGFYGFWIGAAWSGILGVSLYPVMGTRFWCRFGCPMAALLGFIQKIGRYRITVKPDMCISCGNCSSHCEMGIDVRSYAMSNQSFKRASCVGCGMCAHVCPRGVLRLENKWDFHPLSKSLGQDVRDI